MWYCCLPLCCVPWDLILCVSPLLPEPMPAFQLTCSRWAAQWEDTGKGRCVYLLKTKCCCVADGNALEQVEHSDTTVTLQWSLYCRENSFSLNIALNDLFVGFRIWWYKPCHQILFFFLWILLHLWNTRRINTSALYLFKLHIGFLEAANYVGDKNKKWKGKTCHCLLLGVRK